MASAGLEALQQQWQKLLLVLAELLVGNNNSERAAQQQTLLVTQAKLVDSCNMLLAQLAAARDILSLQASDPSQLPGDATAAVNHQVQQFVLALQQRQR